MVQGTSFSPSKQRIEPHFSSRQVMPEVKYLSSSKAKVLMDLDVRQLQGFAEAGYPRDGTSSVRSGGFLRGYPLVN